MLESLTQLLSRPSSTRLQVLVVLQIYYIQANFNFTCLSRRSPGSACTRPAWLKLVRMDPAGARWLQAFDYYQYISTAYLCYGIVRELLLLELTPGPVWGLSGPAHCYLPGRFVLVVPLNRYIGFTISVAHICWRLVQKLSLRPVHSQLALFLVHDEQEIGRLQRRMQRVRLRSMPPRQEALLNIMYLRTSQPRRCGFRFRFRQRSNRTLAHRRRLARVTAQCTIGVCLAFFTCLAILLPLSLNQVLVAANFELIYPGCIQAGWPQLFSLITLPFDILENLFLWVDSGLVLLALVPVAILHKLDLCHQWSNLDLPLRAMRSQLLGVCNTKQQWLSRPVCYSRQMLDTQERMCDFFQHFERADSFISDLNTSGIVMWLSIYVSTEYYHARMQSMHNFLTVGCQVLTFVFVTLYTFILLAVHRAVVESYCTICSLMAYEKSRSKLQYSKIIAFYTSRNRASFTLFRGQQAFLPTTYMTFIGYTLSAGAIINSLFRTGK